ncbi:MAG: hypothetical protein AVDCRST_MAG25-2025 [uncultured Rubrobacteraceae bacterium]|uniref:Uncharacterized protein n=1 Tax=uncultured Rubrobacteraceae bacterium TaxID=349277 RepID=A0A6J4RDC0_9ACTN|nr:MAG: hypothetical protein AVDCRST_MAG25-2025 [uncultured Rubrobacteraceae bacterium]
MDRAARTSSPTAAWDALALRLDGSFRARARGLLGSRFALLDSGGEEWGQLRMLGSYAAEIHAGETASEIERTGEFGARYRMRTGGAPFLIAGPERPDEPLRIFCGGKTYEAETSVLRNTSIARRLTAHAPGSGPEPAGDGVSLSGGIAGRSYTATLPGGAGSALAVAVFLLYRNVAIRRAAF